MPGRPGSGRGDRPVPPGFSGVSVWRPAFVACTSSAGSGDCSICGPGNNDGRSRTPGHSQSPGKTFDAVALHGFPSPRFRRAGTTATEHGKRDLIYGGCSVRFFGPAQKARSAADGRGSPRPASAPPYPVVCVRFCKLGSGVSVVVQAAALRIASFFCSLRKDSNRTAQRGRRQRRSYPNSVVDSTNRTRSN